MQIELFFTRKILHLGLVYMEVGDPRYVRYPAASHPTYQVNAIKLQ